MNHPWASSMSTTGSTPSDRDFAAQQDRVQETTPTTEEEEQPCCDETMMLDQLEQALCVIPAEDKQAYLQACRIVPHLIETESNPVLFLRRDEYDVRAAAQRLVAYWALRKKLFGERAFLPVMDLSGNGALGPDALELLQTGIHAVLPNDRQGRSVICFDREQGEGANPSLLEVNSEGVIPLLLQVSFFNISIVAQNCRSQTIGIVFLVRMRKRAIAAQANKRGIPNHMNFQRMAQGIETALPIRLHSTHIAACVPASSTFTKTIILAMLQRISAWGAFANQNRSPVLHFDASIDKICQRLQSYEFLKEGVPVKLGGSWTYDEYFRSFDQWRPLESHDNLVASAAAGSSSSSAARVLGMKSARAIGPAAAFQPLDVLGNAALMAEKNCAATARIQQEEAFRTVPEESKTAHLKRAPDSKRSATTPKDPSERAFIPSPHPDHGAEEQPCHEIMMAQLEETYCMISAQDKEAFLQARQIAPNLVEAESNPVWFLRREGYNLWAAAQRLVTYWTKRKKIFGERAFLPVMDLSGNGALGPDALELLQTGVQVVLPNDRQGRSVIYLDRERSGAQTPLLLQVGFFNLSVVAQSEKSQVEGIVMLARFRKQATGRVPARDLINQFMDLVSTAFPVRMHSLHIAACAPSSSEFVQTTGLKILHCLCASFLASARFHIDDSEEKICQRLQACDFAPEGLPVKLGGSWTYDRFTLSLSQWYQEDNDQKLPATVAVVKNGCDVHAPGHASALSQSLAILGTAAEMASDTSDEDENIADEHQQHMRQTSVGGDEDRFHYVETVAMQQEGRLNLAEALKTIHDKEKTAYLEAVRRVPNLVENESSPILFLRCDRYDPWAAARRLTTYWKLRLEFFGDRAFLPLNQTGQGALSPEDLEVLNSSYAFVLPNDKDGRSVVGMDRSRLTPSALNNRMGRLRCLFYLFCLLADNERTQRDGCVVILVMGKAAYERDFTVARACVRLISDALPMCIQKIHLVSNSTKVGSSSVFKSIVASTFKMMANVVTPWPTVHHAGSGQELAKQLKEYGLTKRGIPVWIGGSWDIENFHNWQKRRKRYEEDLILNDGEKLDRKRKVNAVHSRQKRERRKIEKEVLQEQCEEIRARNAILLENNKQLEELLETAMSEVAVVERFEATKVNNAAFVEEIRNVPNSAMLQARFAGPSSGDSMLPENQDLSRRLVTERVLPGLLDEALQIELRKRFYDLSRRLGTERDLPGPLDEAMQIQLRNRGNDGILLSNAPPSRTSQTTHLAGRNIDLSLSTPFYQQSAASMFGQQQHIPSYSTSSSGGPVWQQQPPDITPDSSAAPRLQESLTRLGFLSSSPWSPFPETREEGEDDRRRF
jgi:hypothetical protein